MVAQEDASRRSSGTRGDVSKSQEHLRPCCTGPRRGLCIENSGASDRWPSQIKGSVSRDPSPPLDTHTSGTVLLPYWLELATIDRRNHPVRTKTHGQHRHPRPAANLTTTRWFNQMLLACKSFPVPPRRHCLCQCSDPTHSKTEYFMLGFSEFHSLL